MGCKKIPFSVPLHLLSCYSNFHDVFPSLEFLILSPNGPLLTIVNQSSVFKAFGENS